MKFGTLLVFLAFIATLVSGWQYYSIIKIKSRHRDKKKRKSDPITGKINLARKSYYAMTLLITLASGYLMQLILTHKFQVEYVYSYSSRNLSLGYLISAFWAGQEGSFLLWTFFTAIMGVIFIKFAKEFEVHSMLLLNIIQGFFLLILMKANPFSLLPQIPPDGVGLNPLLQNPWMVVHPPVLFMGYAATAFPLIIAWAALVRKEYSQWASRALPWALFASLTLGAGIIIGGFWAYEVLGWGGYWGWDPVENSSLVPWLTTLALLHGLIIQQIKGTLRRTNLLLAIVSFVLVLYATFLTRSGVLADFSVHSFQNLGINTFLILFMLTMLLLGLGTFYKHHKEIPTETIDTSSLNRENALFTGLLILGACAFLTLVGTSSPILTGLIGKPSPVHVSYYNKVNLPIGIVLAILLGITPFLQWKEKGIGNLIRPLILPVGLVIPSTAAAIFFGLSNALFVVFIATASFAFWSNLIILFRQFKVSWKIIGAPLAHVGVGLMLVGIIISGTLDENQQVALTKGTPKQVFDYQLKYMGFIQAANGKDIARIEVTGDDVNFLAQTRFYYSQYNKAWMREPDIKSMVWYDLYLSPLQRVPARADSSTHHELKIKKGERKRVGNYEIYFKGFQIGSHGSVGTMQVGAQLEISDGKSTVSVTPAIFFDQNGKHTKPAMFPKDATKPEEKARVVLTAMNADEKIIQLHFEGIATHANGKSHTAEQIILDVSKKPFMNVLWAGTILILAGTVIAIKRRTTPVG